MGTTNILLIAAIVALLFIALRFFSVKNKPKTFANLSAAEFQAKMKETNVVLLDVRTPNEVAGGYIKGTKLFIDYMGQNFGAEIAKLDKNKNYLVYCRSGNRSSKACDILHEEGFPNLFNLAGGFMFWKGEVAKK